MQGKEVKKPYGLSKILKDIPCLRIFDFLASTKGNQYTISEIAREAEGNRKTTKKILDNYVENRIVRKIRGIGTKRMYYELVDNPVTQALNWAVFWFNLGLQYKHIK